LFDSFEKYFNSESYKVTYIVIGFTVFLGGWMVLILISSIIYRFILEKFICPIDYQARVRLKKIHKEREEKDEETIKEAEEEHKNTQNATLNKKRSKTEPIKKSSETDGKPAKNEVYEKKKL
jgi:hypothetical protein